MRLGGMVRVKEIELARRANGVSQHLRRREESPILVIQGMKLQDVLAGIESVQPASNPGLEITNMACHTSKVSPGTLFFALRGAKADGNQFVPDAVKGTNGKTTTTHLVYAILKATGEGTGLFGTVAYHTPRGEYPSPNTTPESLDLQGFLAEIR